MYTYSRCPKSKCSVWKTEQNLVQISDVRISDIRAVRFVRFVRFVRLFGYTINVRNPNVWLVESINRTSEIQTKWFGFQTLSEILTVWECDNFGKRLNPNVRISDTYCKLSAEKLNSECWPKIDYVTHERNRRNKMRHAAFNQFFAISSFITSYNPTLRR